MTSSLPGQRLTDGALWARVARQARCADSGLDPDQWYPVSIEPAQARHEAAAAIAVCASCPVRAQCLELSLRHWDIGQHGVWGGLVVAERVALRRQRLSRAPLPGPALPVSHRELLVLALMPTYHDRDDGSLRWPPGHARIT